MAAERFGVSIYDLSDRAAAAVMFDEVGRTLGGLDCLVNNAGIGGIGSDLRSLG